MAEQCPNEVAKHKRPRIEEDEAVTAQKSDGPAAGSKTSSSSGRQPVTVNKSSVVQIRAVHEQMFRLERKNPLYREYPFEGSEWAIVALLEEGGADVDAKNLFFYRTHKPVGEADTDKPNGEVEVDIVWELPAELVERGISLLLDERTVPPQLAGRKDVQLLQEKPALLCLKKELLDLVMFLERQAEKQGHLAFDATLMDELVETGRAEECLLNTYYDSQRVHMAGIKRKPPVGFNYLLLDSGKLAAKCCRTSFAQFLEAIFYIGKGSTDLERPFKHLINTRGLNEQLIERSFGSSYKKLRIRKIWSAGHAVVIQKLFMNVPNAEACNRGAAMISARMTAEWREGKSPGKMDLVNKITERLSGPEQIQRWNDTVQRVQLGSRLLLRAFCLFSLERCHRIFEEDLGIMDPANLSGVSGTDSGGTTDSDESSL